jgi:hypothetical protein
MSSTLFGGFHGVRDPYPAVRRRAHRRAIYGRLVQIEAFIIGDPQTFFTGLPLDKTAEFRRED